MIFAFSLVLVLWFICIKFPNLVFFILIYQDFSSLIQCIALYSLLLIPPGSILVQILLFPALSILTSLSSLHRFTSPPYLSFLVSFSHCLLPCVFLTSMSKYCFHFCHLVYCFNVPPILISTFGSLTTPNQAWVCLVKFNQKHKVFSFKIQSGKYEMSVQSYILYTDLSFSDVKICLII